MVNEAYATLSDKSLRAEYDVIIGVTISIKVFEFKRNSEDEARELFLAKIFYPSRLAINKVLSAYKKQLKLLSQDIYDDELVENFSNYLDEFEATLRKASNLFSTHPAPASLRACVHMMRQSIAQAADALEEMRRFCQNYDYKHLSTAESLVRISAELIKEAYALTKYP